MKILIVDDNEINRILLERMLKVKGYTSVHASNGAEALKILKERTDILLVLADIVMPEMNGLELLRSIKESHLWKDLPVIMCSMIAEIDQVRMAVALGCSSYILKPVNRDLLCQKIAMALSKTKPVLGTEQEIMALHEMDHDTYQTVARSFLKILEEEGRLLECVLSSKVGAVPFQLQRLAEGAAIMGAKQLEARIEDLLNGERGKLDIKLELMRVLRDIQHVSSLLKDRIGSPTSPKNARAEFEANSTPPAST